ncbi:MAG: hypothetical protein HZA35_01555 [Parcubacteria group bacterium]|nr:hypothetical protein [Parcubacteria group bacterium]
MTEGIGKIENKGLPVFEDLTLAKKLELILAVVREPVSRELAFKFAGITFERLDNIRQGEIEAVFKNTDVIQEGGKYILSNKGKSELGGNVDLKSGIKRVAEVLSSDLGF